MFIISNFIKKINRRLWKVLFKNARLSYSQSGEDMILDTILCNVKNGFYVDVGANNPFEQSNTHYFYKKGWRGVNIDALPGSMKYFDKVRKYDTNIEAAISNHEKEVTYYMFKTSFYNTSQVDDVERIKTITPLIGVKKIKPIKLSELFDSLKIKTIDFMSVDVEGLDFDVLKSNNWDIYKPKVVIIENFAHKLDSEQKDIVYKFLIDKNYKFYCSTGVNSFFIENTFFKERFGD
jgi:FkbM family methyltransferase